MSTDVRTLHIPRPRARRYWKVPPGDPQRVRVYVWELPVRVTHWLLVLSIVSLAVTGFYIGSPFAIVAGEARGRFVMGYMKLVHAHSATVFTLSLLARVAWMFLGNEWSRWHQFLPVRRERLKGLVPTFLFYTWFRRKAPEYIGHNPLAGLTYAAVFALCILQVVTGYAMYGASNPDSPMAFMAGVAPWIGGLQSTRWIHHIVMWLLIGFGVHHVYSALLMSITEANATVDSIFSGNKFVERKTLEKESKA